MKKFSGLLILLLMLIMGGGIYLIFQSEKKTDTPKEAASTAATAQATATPQPTPTGVPSPTPTETPIPTMPPTPTPTPSPAPTAVPTPTPVIERATEGSFRSETDTWLNLVVKYNIQRSGAEAVLHVDVYVESYSLVTGKRQDDLIITVGGVTTKVGTGPISLPEDSPRTETLLGSAEVPVTPETQCRIDVTWLFNGVYGGKDVPSVSVQSTVDIP